MHEIFRSIFDVFAVTGADTGGVVTDLKLVICGEAYLLN